MFCIWVIFDFENKTMNDITIVILLRVLLKYVRLYIILNIFYYFENIASTVLIKCTTI